MKRNKITEIVIDIFKIVSLIIVTLLAFRYVGDKFSLLDSEDIKKAKVSIKDAKKEVATSKEIRQKMSKEVKLIKDRSIEHKKILKASKKNVDSIKSSNDTIKDNQLNRRKTVADILKKNI